MRRKNRGYFCKSIFVCKLLAIPSVSCTIEICVESGPFEMEEDKGEQNGYLKKMVWLA